MTAVEKFARSGAAGAEAHARAERYLGEHEDVAYWQALYMVIGDDEDLTEAYLRWRSSYRKRHPDLFVSIH